MSIINELVAHHATLRQLYAQSENDPQAFEEFTRHLIVHHTMEEKYFYDILQEIAAAEHGALEAVNEHHIIELIIKDAEGFPREHNHFPIKIEGLGEYTVPHFGADGFQKFFAGRRIKKQLFDRNHRPRRGTDLANRFNFSALNDDFRAGI